MQMLNKWMILQGYLEEVIFKQPLKSWCWEFMRIINASFLNMKQQRDITSKQMEMKI